MSFIELTLLAVALSMDAFAVAISIGLASGRAGIKQMLVVGLYFGIFQALMPLLGYLLTTLFASKIIAFDHWIAFVLLSFIGGRMIYESFKKEEAPKEGSADEQSLAPTRMLPLAIATSIDALAAGVSLAFLKVNIVSAVTFIGITTLVISMLGVKIGNLFGLRFKSKAELIGGIILVTIGLKILIEHLFFL